MTDNQEKALKLLNAFQNAYYDSGLHASLVDIKIGLTDLVESSGEFLELAATYTGEVAEYFSDEESKSHPKAKFTANLSGYRDVARTINEELRKKAAEGFDKNEEKTSNRDEKLDTYYSGHGEDTYNERLLKDIFFGKGRKHD